MSEYDWEDDDLDSNDGSGSNAMKDLRKAYKTAQKQNKELADQLAEMQKQIRTRSVKDVLASKGLPEKISAFIPETATTSEEVEAWVAEYGDIFGVAPAQQSSDGGSEPKPVDPSLQALGRISATQQSGQPFSMDSDQIASRISGASSIEELNTILYGNPAGPMAV